MNSDHKCNPSKNYNNLILIKRDGKLGLDTAHKLGFNFAKENNYENYPYGWTFITGKGKTAISDVVIEVFQIEMKYSAYKLGFKLKEIPITFKDRQFGESKMNMSIFKEAFWGVLKLRNKKF